MRRETWQAVYDTMAPAWARFNALWAIAGLTPELLNGIEKLHRIREQAEYELRTCLWL